MDTRLLYIVATSLLKNVGPILGRSLINGFDSPENLFAAKPKELMQFAGLSKARAQTLSEECTSGQVLLQAERLIRKAEKSNVKIFAFDEEEYPQRINEISSAPLILYYKGEASLNHFRNIGIVGTRNCTERGKINCEHIIDDLMPYNIHTISGLAFGIDATCHKYSVEQNIPTIAVVGHGLDMIYPSQHEALADKIIENGGILSEFAFGVGPDAPHFPMRNRLVAALSDALIVVESKKSGGSLITADLASQFHKDVFAIPGRLNDKYSAGCNKLIKMHRASLLQSGKDVSYILRWEEDTSIGVQKQLFVDLDDTEKNVLKIIGFKDARSLDKIHIQSKIPLGQLSAILMGLEFKGIIKSIPGSRYIKC